MSCHSFAWGTLMLYGTEKLTLPQAKLCQNLMELMIPEGDEVIVKAYKCTGEENKGKHRFTTHFPPPPPAVLLSLSQPCLQSVWCCGPYRALCLWNLIGFIALPVQQSSLAFQSPPQGFSLLKFMSPSFLNHVLIWWLYSSLSTSQQSKHGDPIGSVFIVYTPTATWAMFLLFLEVSGKYFSAFRVQSQSWVTVSMESSWVRAPASHVTGQEGAYRENKP